MMRALNRREIRDVDRQAVENYGLPGLVLMENAGRSAVELLVDRLGLQGNVVLVCGKGNNAGDGFVMARHLENRGITVELLLAAPADSLTGDAAVFYQVLVRSGTPLHDLSRSTPAEWRDALRTCHPTWIIDAILGTGLVGPAREPFATAIDAVNGIGVPVFAVDVPSGLDCDTGTPAGSCIRANDTGTFVARKIGFDNPASRAWTGEVHVLGIGLPHPMLRDLQSRGGITDPTKQARWEISTGPRFVRRSQAAVILR